MIMYADHWDNQINDSMTSIHVSQLVRVDISFDVAVLTIETFYPDDWSSYCSRYMMYLKIRSVKIWCKIMHMKRNLCKRPGSHRGKYIKTDMHKHLRAANATHIIACTHTPTQYSWVDDSLTVMTPSTTHSSRQEAAYLGISMPRQPTQVPLSLQ